MRFCQTIFHPLSFLIKRVAIYSYFHATRGFRAGAIHTAAIRPDRVVVTAQPAVSRDNAGSGRLFYSEIPERGGTDRLHAASPGMPTNAQSRFYIRSIFEFQRRADHKDRDPSAYRHTGTPPDLFLAFPKGCQQRVLMAVGIATDVMDVLIR